jgi:hypothetical protein
MTALSDAMEALTARLAIAMRVTQDVKHNLTKGEMRETFLAAALEPHLPSRFRVLSGEIVNLHGERGAQHDLIFVDGASTVSFLLAGNQGVHPVESVAAVLEVKSDTEKATLKEAVDNIASAKRLLEPGAQQDWTDQVVDGRRQRRSALDGDERGRTKFFGGIVCLTATTSSRTVAKNFAELCREVPPADRPNALVVVGALTMQWSEEADDAGTIWSDPERSEGAVLLDEPDHAMLLFYVALMEWLREYRLPTLDLIEYTLAMGLTDPNMSVIAM